MGNNVHDIVKAERKKRGIPPMYWSREMARLAQSQANYCAKVGHMVHSDRYAFQGGENLCGGKGKFSPRQIVNSWLHSKAGHREYMLSNRVTKAGVGIAKRNGKMFYAWAFSDASPTYPDCPSFKSKAKKSIKTISMRRILMRTKPLKLMVSLVLGCIGLLGMALGLHGVYVYFNRLEFLFGGEGIKLFFALDVPIRLQSMVMWASERGLQSWFIPLLIFFFGLSIFTYSRLWDIVSRFLDKIRP
ncbi:hypothetical protein LCGC14_0627690 [marine sediment metagenome]|uniref:SCP domain-containing protein n=1 Tax=marine sediment metagenome TaxID=412755 RepID=A0A0F9R7Y3_9ZZZZ